MEELELTTTEGLVRRYASELIPHKNDARLATHTVAVLGSVTLALSLLSVLELVGPRIMLLVMSAFVVPGALLAELFARRRYQTELRQFYDDLRASPWRLYEAVATKFGHEIERQRARTLGPDSDWGQARRPLEAAARETARSVAYWEQRCTMDPGNDVARQQRETALRLRDKFQQALAQLDARAQVLVTFFDECEARLAVLQFAKRDYEEVTRLGALSERADDIVAEARATLSGIGRSFLSEAIRVGNALGGIERVGLLGLADSVSVDRIETLADRILESSLHERDMLERLTKDVLN
jgi:hypothetical protein